MSLCVCVCVQCISPNVGLSLLVFIITPNGTMDLFKPKGVSTMTSHVLELSGPGGYLRGKHVDCTSTPLYYHPLISSHVQLRNQ